MSMKTYTKGLARMLFKALCVMYSQMKHWRSYINCIY